MSKQTERVDQVVTHDEKEVDWLAGWGEIEFKADPDNPAAIEDEQDQIRWYVRGYLEERSDRDEPESDGRRYRFVRFERFEFIEAGRSPLRFRVHAILHPSARRPPHHEEHNTPRGGRRGPIGGSHLVPPPPPKPGTDLG